MGLLIAAVVIFAVYFSLFMKIMNILPEQEEKRFLAEARPSFVWSPLQTANFVGFEQEDLA